MMRRLRRAIDDPGKAYRALTYKLLSTIGHKRYRKFIVLARSRTGSNVLIQFLMSHPHIHADGEVFQRLNGPYHEGVLASAFPRQPFYVKARGFKIFYYHPLDDDSGGIWRDLAGMDDLFVIHLKRQNILRTAISASIASRQGIWAQTSHGSHEQEGASSPEAADGKAVRFTADELTSEFERTREWERTGDEMFSSHPLLSIDYEHLVDDPSGTFRKITEFLGVEYVQPRTNLQKQNRESLRELVTNYDELKTAFRDTEWEPFFDE